MNGLLEKILSVHKLAQLHVFDISQYLSELSRVNPLEALQLLELSAIRLKEEADASISFIYLAIRWEYVYVKRNYVIFMMPLRLALKRSGVCKKPHWKQIGIYH